MIILEEQRMKNNLLAILTILFVGITAGKSVINETVKESPPVIHLQNFNPKQSNATLLINLNDDQLSVSSTAIEQPKFDIKIDRPVDYIVREVPVQVTDTITNIVIRKDLYPISSSKLEVKKPNIPNSVKRI